jgi:hypothetical protein
VRSYGKYLFYRNESVDAYLCSSFDLEINGRLMTGKTTYGDWGGKFLKSKLIKLDQQRFLN